METNETAAASAEQGAEISIDLLDRVGQPETTKATVSIPHETDQTVRATVEPAEGDRWRCDFHVDSASAAVSQPLEEEVVRIGELVDWVSPVLSIIEALVTEAGC